MRGIIRSSAWLMRVLEIVGRAGLPDARVGAGALRDLVWGQLYGPGFAPGDVHDVDVAFLDPVKHAVPRAGCQQGNHGRTVCA